MISNRAFAEAVANSLKEVREAPKCDPQESAALTEAALIALRKLASETHAAGEETEVGKWRHALDELIHGSKSRPVFLEEFAALTASFDPSDLLGLSLQSASENLLLAANAEVGRRFRLDALLNAGLATGAVVMLLHPAELEASFRSEQAKRAASASHKDHRADRAHVSDWLARNRSNYKTDAERVDAIMAHNEVSASRSTVARWVTEWNREQRAKASAV